MLDGAANQRLDELERRERELTKKTEEQETVMSKLKDDRAYYRTKCDEKELVDRSIVTVTRSQQVK